MTGLHAEAPDLFPAEILGGLVLILVLNKGHAFRAVRNRAAEDDEVIALPDIGARGNGAEGEHVGRTLGKSGHGLREAARDRLLHDVELLLLVVAVLKRHDNAGDLDVLAQSEAPPAPLAQPDNAPTPARTPATPAAFTNARRVRAPSFSISLPFHMLYSVVYCT